MMTSETTPASGTERPTPTAEPPASKPGRPAGTTPAPAERSVLRAVSIPTEHGGWGLTVEPCLLGLFLAPSWAGLCLSLLAFVAFLLRTPAKIAAVDIRRKRMLPRTKVALGVAAAEAALGVALLIGTALLAKPNWWVPALVAAPLIVLQASFEIRSKSRRLTPELAGSVAVSGVVAMIVIAGGGPTTIAIGAWILLSARATTSIPFVRDQIFRIHNRPRTPGLVAAGDAVAIAAAIGAAIIDRQLIPGAVAVALIVGAQRLTALPPPPKPKIIGIRQMLFGFALVLITWIGTLAIAAS